MQEDPPQSPPGAAAAPSSPPGKAPRRRSGPRSRSSPYKGVTQYRRTGKWEAHIWIPNPRGRGFQRHLGSYHTAEEAARCFDRATIRVRGPHEELNFPLEDYRNDPFMLEHAKTERFRFMEEMRRCFAIQLGEGAGCVGMGGGGAGGRRLSPPRRPAAAQEGQQPAPALPLFRGPGPSAAALQEKAAARRAGMLVPPPPAEDILLQTPGPFPPEQQFWASPAAGPASPAALAARTPLSFATALGCDPSFVGMGPLPSSGAAFPSSILSGGGGGMGGPAWMGAALTPVFPSTFNVSNTGVMRQFIGAPGGGAGYLPPAVPAVGPLGPLDPGHDDNLLDSMNSILGGSHAEGPMDAWFLGSPCG